MDIMSTHRIKLCFITKMSKWAFGEQWYLIGEHISTHKLCTTLCIDSKKKTLYAPAVVLYALFLCSCYDQKNRPLTLVENDPTVNSGCFYATVSNLYLKLKRFRLKKIYALCLYECDSTYCVFSRAHREVASNLYQASKCPTVASPLLKYSLGSGKHHISVT